MFQFFLTEHILIYSFDIKSEADIVGHFITSASDLKCNRVSALSFQTDLSRDAFVFRPIPTVASLKALKSINPKKKLSGADLL